MKYEVLIDGNPHQVEMQRTEEGFDCKKLRHPFIEGCAASSCGEQACSIKELHMCRRSHFEFAGWSSIAALTRLGGVSLCQG